MKTFENVLDEGRWTGKVIVFSENTYSELDDTSIIDKYFDKKVLVEDGISTCIGVKSTNKFIFMLLAHIRTLIKYMTENWCCSTWLAVFSGL